LPDRVEPGGKPAAFGAAGGVAADHTYIQDPISSASCAACYDPRESATLDLDVAGTIDDALARQSTGRTTLAN